GKRSRRRAPGDTQDAGPGPWGGPEVEVATTAVPVGQPRDVQAEDRSGDLIGSADRRYLVVVSTAGLGPRWPHVQGIRHATVCSGVTGQRPRVPRGLWE